MQGSINFNGSLIGDITGGGGGSGDEVIITPIVTSGTKIADVSVNGVEKDLYCPTLPAPTEVDITPVVTSGTKIADVSVNGVEKDLYCPTPPAPTEVDITPVVTSGTKIADVSIGGVEKDLYSPDYGADITALDGRLDTAEYNITDIKQSLSQLDGLIIYKDLTPTDDYAEFNDGSNLPLLSLISTIEPIQEGSGDPSPTNVRPISGWDEVNVTVADDVENPTVSNVYIIDLEGTRYGGTLDVVSGKLTVDRASVDLGTVNWNKYNSSAKTYFRTSEQLADAKKSDNPSTTHNLMCSDYKEDTWSHVIDGSGYDGNICIGWNNNAYIGIYDSRYVDVSTSDFKTAMNGVQLVYELATPIEVQLTPTQVKSLLGQNYISSDVGDITNVKYLGMLNLS